MPESRRIGEASDSRKRETYMTSHGRFCKAYVAIGAPGAGFG